MFMIGMFKMMQEDESHMYLLCLVIYQKQTPVMSDMMVRLVDGRLFYN